MDNLINIENKDGQLLVSSLEVAKNFGRVHKNVIQTIKNLVAENSATKSLFYESTYN